MPANNAEQADPSATVWNKGIKVYLNNTINHSFLIKWNHLKNCNYT